MKSVLSVLMIIFTLTVSAQDNYFENTIEIYFEFEISSRAELDQLTRIISIDNVTAENAVRAYANEQEFTRFLDLQYEFEVLPHPGTLIKSPKMLEHVNIREITDWDFYPTYEAYMDMMQQFVDDYPDLCEIHHIGFTYEEREIIALKISDNVGEQEAEPEFLYTSSMHGDETTGYVLMLRLIDYLLGNYGSDPRVTNMVDEIQIYINPLANPDGSYAAGNQSIYGATRSNAHGVNLNRNYPDPKGGPHPDGNEWQIETIGFMEFAENHNFIMSSNIHGGTEVCNYPWDTWPELTADDEWWVYVCEEYAETVHEYSNNYMTGYNNGITNGYAWYTIEGGRQDYMNYFQQCREFTLEISNVKLLPAAQLPAHWDYNYRSFLNYMEQVLYGVRGIIMDDSSGDPIVGEVYILGHEEDSSWVYSTLPEGNYSRVIYEGIYDIKYDAPGYFPKVYEDVEIINHSTTVINVSLVPQFSGIPEPESMKVNIFPNPVTSNYFQIISAEGINQIRLLDLNGKLVLDQVYSGEKRIFVSTNDLPANTYLLQVSMGAIVETRKVVIK